MPLTSRIFEGPLDVAANSRNAFERKFPNATACIHKHLDDVTVISRHQMNTFTRGGGMHVDLQKPPYERGGRWWALLAFQSKHEMHGSLEIECDVPFPHGEIADAMLHACGNAGVYSQDGQERTVQFKQWVLYTGERPA